jgi:hypothetical protein
MLVILMDTMAKWKCNRVDHHNANLPLHKGNTAPSKCHHSRNTENEKKNDGEWPETKRMIKTIVTTLRYKDNFRPWCNWRLYQGGEANHLTEQMIEQQHRMP